MLILLSLQVIVGGPLFEIETSGTVTIAVSPVITTPTVSEAVTSKAVDISNASADRTRKPLIKFIGKRSLVVKPSANIIPSTISKPETTTIQSVISPSVPKKVVKEGTGVPFYEMKGGAWYGRPRLSQAEMDAIESGGATSY